SASYRQIIKATGIIGGANAFVIFLRIARMKVLAVLLGPTGIGLMGIYSSLVSTVATVAGMGIASSGVRQIAEADGIGDRRTTRKVLLVLVSLSLFLGVCGAGTMLLFRNPI